MKREEPEDGRIPFRVRIGVTGHRALADEEALAPRVREQVQAILERFKGKNTTICLSVISQLAEGADRLVVREVAAQGWEARLECFLPLPRDEYVRLQGFNPASKRKFDEMLSRATVVREVPVPTSSASTSDCYRAAGQVLVARCDVLLALWDGLPSKGGGGTAEMLTYAAARSKPCIWIEAEGKHEAHHNFDSGGRDFFEMVAARARPNPRIEWSPMDHPRTTTQVLDDAFDRFDEFNGESGVAVSPPTPIKALAPWVAGPYVRASALADRWHRRFQWSARLIVLMAALAAAMLGIGLTYGEEAEGWALAEAALLFLALGGLVFVKTVGFHRRWLCYRFLAERLRSAHFLAPTGTDFLRQARSEDAYSGTEGAGWLMRAFEEVWDRRPKHPPSVRSLSRSEQTRLKKWLSGDWIGKQIAYHEDSAKRHRRWHVAQSLAVVVLFLGTIAFAILHALRTFEHTPVLFGIVLPAAAASLGVMLTVNQHQALSTRSTKMRSDLAVVRRDLLEALPEEIDSVSSRAARVIAQETGTWLDSMWFLDIEHP